MVNSNAQVLEKLTKEGFINIELYGDAIFSGGRNDKNLFNKKVLEKKAKHEIDMLYGRSLFKHTLFSIQSNENLFSFFSGLVGLILGVILNNTWLLSGGIIVLIFVFSLITMAYKMSGNVGQIYESIDYGYWDKAEKFLNNFHNYEKEKLPQYLKVLLDKNRALLLAIRNHPEVALQKVEEKYGFLKDIAPLEYMILISEIYYINGEYKEFLKQMNDIYEQYPDNAISILNITYAETLYGDKDRAKMLLHKVKIEELPIYTLPIVDFTRGLLIQEDNANKKLEYLQKSLMGIEKFKNVPVFPRIIAIIAGYYAIALHDNNYEKAKNILDPYWGILKIHGNKMLLEDIDRKMPYFK
ncbi:MAG: hypothetical protein FNT15_09810 [Sulfurovum sp.]|nr:MAG: hypothetical protein FNT15_09810 [Sulfurovum sp.]